VRHCEREQRRNSQSITETIIAPFLNFLFIFEIGKILLKNAALAQEIQAC